MFALETRALTAHLCLIRYAACVEVWNTSDLGGIDTQLAPTEVATSGAR